MEPQVGSSSKIRKIEILVKGGPGKFELENAYFRGRKDIDDVDFKVVDPRTGESYLPQASVWECIPVRGREVWRLKGFVKFPRFANETKFTVNWPKDGATYPYHVAEYNTRKRTGVLVVEVPWY